MTALTAGHLASNGGIRGHSAGDFYPYRVMIQGQLDNLKHWVIDPQGKKVEWFSGAKAACILARCLHGMNS